MADKREARLPHQEEAVRRALENDGSILLSHPMGSGKTRTSVEIVEELRKAGKATRALVVVPSSLRTNYHENGVKRWAKGRRSLILGSVAELHPDIHDKHIPGADYYVVSYDMFKKDPDKYISRLHPDTLVVDEVHNFRNEGTKNFDSMKLARSKVRNFIGMTGTVFNNDPSDVYPLVDLVSNGKHELGSSKEDFKKRFIGGTKHTDFRGNTTGGTHLKATHTLKRELQRWIHHASENDVQAGDIPEKVVEDVMVEMSPKQKTQYDFVMRRVPSSVRRQIRMGLPASRKEAFHILPMLQQARAVSNSSAFLDADTPLERAWRETPKTNRVIADVVAHLNDHPKNQALLHSHLVNGGVDVLAQGLHDQHVPFGVISGGIKQADRDKYVKAYNSGKIRALILSSAGTTGLNLPNTTFHAALDGHYNPAVIDQIEARGIRAGGQSYKPKKQRKVIVKRYKTVYPPGMLQRMGLREKENSVDEWIYGLANDKTEINAQAEALLKTSAVDFIRKQLRAPIIIGESKPGMTAVHVEAGERTIPNDLMKYHNDPDYRRNALIAAVSLAAVAAGAYATFKNPKAMKALEETSKKLPLLENVLGSVGPSILALGGLGLMNSDPHITRNLALIGGGALATYRASKGDTSKVPLALKAVGIGLPLATAGLTYAGSRAEELEDRKNVVTQVFPAGRYVAPHALLNAAEGHTLQSIGRKFTKREMETGI